MQVNNINCQKQRLDNKLESLKTEYDRDVWSYQSKITLFVGPVQGLYFRLFSLFTDQTGTNNHNGNRHFS